MNQKRILFKRVRHLGQDKNDNSFKGFETCFNIQSTFCCCWVFWIFFGWFCGFLLKQDARYNIIPRLPLYIKILTVRFFSPSPKESRTSLFLLVYIPPFPSYLWTWNHIFPCPFCLCPVLFPTLFLFPKLLEAFIISDEV